MYRIYFTTKPYTRNTNKSFIHFVKHLIHLSLYKNRTKKLIQPLVVKLVSNSTLILYYNI